MLMKPKTLTMNNTYDPKEFTNIISPPTPTVAAPPRHIFRGGTQQAQRGFPARGKWPRKSRK